MTDRIKYTSQIKIKKEMKEGTEMKKMKKMMALVIAVVMMMAMSATTMAEEPDYKITIQNPVVGQTYSAYKLFDVTRTDDKDDDLTDEKYSYTIIDTDTDGEWYDILSETGTNYFTFTPIGSTRVYNVKETADFNVAEFAAYLNKIDTKPASVGNSGVVTDGAASATITLDSSGYYFVDSTLGALCSLGTASNTVTIKEKNAFPTIDKKVYEDSKKAYQDFATVDISEDISFKMTVNTGVGYEENGTIFGTGNDADFVITDVFTNGTVYWDSVKITDEEGKIKNDKAEAEWTENQDYEIDSINNTITLKTSALSQLAADKNIYIEYTAKLTNAIVDTNYANTATLNYKGYTMSDSASVITYDIDIFKYTGENTPLAGAKFKLYKEVDGTKKYVTTDTTGKVTGWITETDTEKGTEFVSSGIQNDYINIDGLDADTYHLEETVAPDGYNKLTSAVTIVVDENGNITDTTDNIVKVQNQTGSLLPETGGIGTTIFYAAGALLVIGGVVVLVTRKRMENQ